MFNECTGTDELNYNALCVQTFTYLQSSFGRRPRFYTSQEMWSPHPVGFLTRLASLSLFVTMCAAVRALSQLEAGAGKEEGLW